MPDRPASVPRVYILTLGCPKNDADSRSALRRLTEARALVVGEPEEATHILVNTCGFIQDAKEESIAAILDVCAGHPDKEVLAMGCSRSSRPTSYSLASRHSLSASWIV